MEKKNKVNYLRGKVPQPETERYIFYRDENESKHKSNIYSR